MNVDQLLKHLQERNTMLDLEAVRTIHRLRQLLLDLLQPIESELER